MVVREGLAWAFARLSVELMSARRKRQREPSAGVYAHGCIPAWEWRAQQRFFFFFFFFFF